MSEQEQQQSQEQPEVQPQVEQSVEEKAYGAFPDVEALTENTSQTDPFSELLQQVEDTSAPQEAVPSVEPQAEVPKETVEDFPQSKENPEQYQYWQSQADKRTKELTDVLGTFGVESVDELQAKYSDMGDIVPIARYIKSNPGVLDTVQNSLSNGQPQGEPQEQGNPEPSLKQPEKPTKPNNYDALDAYSDPSSESFQYRESVDSYRDSMLEYSNAENQSLRQSIEQERAVQQQRETEQNLKQQLVSQYEMKNDEVDKFVQYMSSPESMTLGNLVTLWNAQNNVVSADTPPPAPTVPDPKVGEMQRQREKLAIPQPVSVVPGSGENADRSAEDSVMDDMISDHKRANPW